ncbi:MAG TPA: sigma-70 family RNA polymerase sigma factor [Fimbriimonadales bacterium]|nr:sigma-70 family RNA polymerase sigma factor [Fimbriimonadales bacterium]
MKDRFSDVGILLERAKRGDNKAWNKLVEHFQNLVYSIPARMGLQTEDCNDVFQTTFVALYQNMQNINEPKALSRWLAVTASREALRVRRLGSKHQGEVPEEITLEDLLVLEERSAEEMAIEALESDKIWAAVRSLPDRCKRLLEVLFSRENLSYEEISRMTGMPVGAIGPTRARCLEQLRKILQKEGFFEQEVVSQATGGGS